MNEWGTQSHMQEEVEIICSWGGSTAFCLLFKTVVKLAHDCRMAFCFSYFTKLHWMLQKGTGTIFPLTSPNNSPGQDAGKCSKSSVTVTSTWHTLSLSPFSFACLPTVDLPPGRTARSPRSPLRSFRAVCSDHSLSLGSQALVTACNVIVSSASQRKRPFFFFLFNLWSLA